MRARGKKKRLNGGGRVMGKERDSSPIVHTVASPLPLLLPTSRFPFTVTAHTHTHTHTFLRNEPDYWLNPDRGITYSVKSSFSQGESNGESTRDRDRDEGCVHAGLPRRNPSPLSPLAPFVRPPFPRHVPREDSSWIHVNVRECG